MRRILLCIPPALALVLFQACEDSNSGGGDGGTFTFDGGFTPPPQPTNVPPGTPPPPPVDSGPLPVVVVATFRGEPKSGIEVVAHDATGAVIATQTTGADGKTIFATAPAMVSALLGTTDPGGGHQIVTWMGVEAGDVLATSTVDLTGGNGQEWDIDQTGTLDGGTEYNANIGRCSSSGPFPIVLYPTFDCLRPSSSVLVTGYDTYPNVTGFAYKRDAGAPNADGGPTAVTVGAWAAPSSTKVIATGLDLANGYGYANLSAVADNNGFPLNSPTGTSDAGTDFPTATGFADALQASVRYQPNANFGSMQTVGKRTAVASSVTLDFTTALPLVTNVTSDMSNLVRPKITITTASSLAAADGGVVRYQWQAPGADFPDQWIFVVPPSTTSVTAPAMPMDATPWLPPPTADGGQAPFYQPPRAVFFESDLLPGYKEFRQGAAVLLPYAPAFGNDPESAVVLPAAGNFRMTSFMLQPS